MLRTTLPPRSDLDGLAAEAPLNRNRDPGAVPGPAAVPPQEGVLLAAVGHAHLHHGAAGAAGAAATASAADVAAVAHSGRRPRPLRVLPAAGLDAVPAVCPRRFHLRFPGDGRAASGTGRAGRDPARPSAGCSTGENTGQFLKKELHLPHNFTMS